MPDLAEAFHAEVTARLGSIAAEAAAGGLDAAIDLIAGSLRRGGVIQAFGTGHSQAFAMEIAGRAGGLIPANAIRLEDLALHGSLPADRLGGPELERDPAIVEELFSLYPINPEDIFVIASNSGVNNSIVGMALKAKQAGHRLIAVTSLEHTGAVQAKHVSGKRLADIADIVIDNRAPYGDATLQVTASTRVGAVSSITAAFIAQLLTIGVASRLAADGSTPPVYLSANIPEGDAHNSALEARFGNRIKRGAARPTETNERLEDK